MKTTTFVTASCMLACFAVGCSTETPQVKEPETPVPAILEAPKPGPARADVATPTSGSVQIDDKIMKACGDIPDAHFAFDSAAIAGSAKTTLDAVAKCFVSGALKDKPIKLVGHTDQRGETEYNLALGQRRAGSVADYFATVGLSKGRIQSSSKGEFEATGTDEDGWSKDRRVEILLGE